MSGVAELHVPRDGLRDAELVCLSVRRGQVIGRLHIRQQAPVLIDAGGRVLARRFIQGGRFLLHLGIVLAQLIRSAGSTLLPGWVAILNVFSKSP